MKLTVKNKFIAAMEDLITVADKKGGIPNEFHLTKLEYAGFLKDIQMTHDIAHPHVIVDVFDEGERFNLTNNVMAKNPLPDQIVKYLVDKWVKNEYNIRYKNIPLIYQVDKEDTEKPEPPDRKGW